MTDEPKLLTEAELELLQRAATEKKLRPEYEGEKERYTEVVITPSMALRLVAEVRRLRQLVRDAAPLIWDVNDEEEPSTPELQAMAGPWERQRVQQGSHARILRIGNDTSRPTWTVDNERPLTEEELERRARPLRSTSTSTDPKRF